MDLLYRNLNSLVLLNPSLSNPTLLKCIYKKLFQVPDKHAFHQVIHFILNVICPKKCKNGYIWPVLNRLCERQFLNGICSIIVELREEFPQYEIPNVPTSFLTNPGGPKFTTVMIKLSMIALELSIHDPSVRKFAEQGSGAINPYLDLHLKVLKLEIIYGTKKFCETDIYMEKLRLESTKLASELCEKWKSTCSKITDQETELSTLLSTVLVLTDTMKESLLDIRNHQVIIDWSSKIETKRVNTEKLLEKMKECDRRMDAAYKIVESVIELRKADHCLDGSELQLNIPMASLELLVPAIKNLQVALFSEDGAIILSSLVLISNECLKSLFNTMEKKGVLEYLQSFPHAPINDLSFRLKKLSQTGNSMLQSLGELTENCNEFIENTIDNHTISDMGKQWMEQYQLENLMPPLPFVPENKDASNKSGIKVGYIPCCELIPDPVFQEHLNAILSCKSALTPPRSFFFSLPVNKWTSQPEKSKTVANAVTTEKKCILKASRLPVLCSSTHKNSLSVFARSRLVYSSKKVDTVFEEGVHAPDVNIVPTPNAKRSDLSSLLSPLATELPETPETVAIQDIHFYEEEPNTPDILKHTYNFHQSEVASVSQTVSNDYVDVISHFSREFDDSVDVEMCDISALLNSGFVSPTDSISNLSGEPYSCKTPAATDCFSEDLPNRNGFPATKSKDCTPTFVPNGCSVKENDPTPTGNKKGKTPTTLERIILRYKKFKESKK